MGTAQPSPSRWRIRHKLMLGLGLVVLLLALLLSGTLRGLYSYYTTMNGIRAKLAELNLANDLKEEIARLVARDSLARLEQRPWQVKERTAPVRDALEKYRQQLEVNQQRAVDEDSHEAELLAVLAGNLDEFERLVPHQARPRIVMPGHEPRPHDLDRPPVDPEKEYQDQLAHGAAVAVAGLLGRPPVAPLQTATVLVAAATPKEPLLHLVHQTTLNAGDLQTTINDQLNDYLGGARRHYQVALWIIVPASVIGLLSMAGLLRSFYGWVFNPIRDLEAGVKRVAQGEFDRAIEVASGDEMEDLAAAFNDMMRRLADLYNDLARQVNERSRQLVRSERLASVGYLAAGVAHEINNPLHSIALCSEALEARLTDLIGSLRLQPSHAPDLEVISRYLRMIQEEAFRCKQITERLLEFSRPGERKREATDLVGLVQSVIDSVRVLPHGKAKAVTLEAGTERVPGGKLRSLVNAEEVRSVLLNLAINALESMEEGGVLRVAVGQKDGMVELRFTDTGCGMSAEVLENIFEPFFTRSRTGKGTGLGLTISHRIIQQHGGEIEATSPGPDQGSTFVVRLPLYVELGTDAGRSSGREPDPSRPLPFPPEPRGTGRQAA